MNGNLIESLEEKNALLCKRVRELEDENARLRQQNEFLTRHKSLAAGIAGERLIGKLINGAMTANAESFDITSCAGVQIEVKIARLTVAVNGRDTKKWAWSKVFGSGGAKYYDFIILIAETDPRWRAYYPDPDSPYVLFCVPYGEVEPLTTGMGGSRRQIHLTTNPRTARCGASALFRKYQTTAADLHCRFGI